MTAKNEMNITNLTVFTDASFCSDTKAGGGAVWARGDGDNRLSLSYHVEAPSSNAAEIIAACKGILAVAEHPPMLAMLAQGPRTRLVLVIDCLGVRQAFEEGSASLKDPRVASVVAQVKALQVQHGFFFKINHVPAHKGASTPRSWVNEWCDKEAKKRMRWMRDRILKPKYEGQALVKMHVKEIADGDE